MDDRARIRILDLLGGAVEFTQLDHRLVPLFGLFDCRRWAALEFGCWHGWHTTQLARRFRRVVACDARPDNVAYTLLRLNLLGIENVSVRLTDIRTVQEPCDVLVHVGVLYHLSGPVAHLHTLPPCQVLCLDTHINRPGLTPSYEVFQGTRYTGGLYQEAGWKDPLSGLSESSLWLDEDVLLAVLRDCGFWIVHQSGYEVPSGPRVTIVAVKGQYV